MRVTAAKTAAGLALMIGVLAAGQAWADVRVIVSGANLQDEKGVLAPTGSVVLLVLDGASDGFTTNLTIGCPLTVGSNLSGTDKPTNDLIIGKLDLSSLDMPGQLLNITTNINLGGPVAAGRPLALYWFPSLTPADATTVAFVRYGIAAGTSSTLPADGNVSEFDFYTASRGGTNPDSAGLASLPPTVIGDINLLKATLDVVDTNVLISFTTVSNAYYEVQSKTDLVTSIWSTITSNLVGTGGALTNIDIGAAASSQRFYRVRGRL
jgi:hypothetical protein